MVEIRPETFVQPMGDEANLLIFLMDGSGSMADTSTPDGRRKADHLEDIVRGLLERLANSSKAPAFRVSLIYFSDSVNVATDDEGAKFYPVNTALQFLRNPVEEMRGGRTAIADAIGKAAEIVDKFVNHPDIPDRKYVTLFLFTDGQETVKTPDDVRIAVQKFKSHVEASPTVATISFGSDADENLLMEIADEPNERQIRHLDRAKVLEHLPSNPYKLFIQGHVEGELTKEKIEAIRQFVDVLSETEREG